MKSLTLTTRLILIHTAVRFRHSYLRELKRGDTLIAEGSTTIACGSTAPGLQVIQ